MQTDNLLIRYFSAFTEGVTFLIFMVLSHICFRHELRRCPQSWPVKLKLFFEASSLRWRSWDFWLSCTCAWSWGRAKDWWQLSCRSWGSLFMAPVVWQWKKLKQDDCLSKKERNFFVESSSKKVPLIHIIPKFHCVFSYKVTLATSCVPVKLPCFRAMQLEWQNLSSAQTCPSLECTMGQDTS